MEFEFGERVICAGMCGYPETTGLPGTIIAHHCGYYGVQFDCWMGGHSCAGLGVDGYCLWVCPGELFHLNIIPAANRGYISLLEENKNGF